MATPKSTFRVPTKLWVFFFLGLILSLGLAFWQRWESQKVQQANEQILHRYCLAQDQVQHYEKTALQDWKKLPNQISFLESLKIMEEFKLPIGRIKFPKTNTVFPRKKPLALQKEALFLEDKAEQLLQSFDSLPKVFETTNLNRPEAFKALWQERIKKTKQLSLEHHQLSQSVSEKLLNTFLDPVNPAKDTKIDPSLYPILEQLKKLKKNTDSYQKKYIQYSIPQAIQCS